MLPEKVKKSNIAAGVWFISMIALLYHVSASDGGKIWDEDDIFGIAVFSVHAISLFAALWYYAEGKGYSGLLGFGLAFLYVLGLIILLILPDKTKSKNTTTKAAIDSSPAIVPFKNQGNYFVRLFAGDVPLVVTYWVWGGLIGGLLSGGVALIEFNYASIVVVPYGVSMIQAFYWFLLAYVVFIWVAIWRSAGKYQGGGWGVVARVMVVAGVLSTLGAFVQGLDDEVSVAEEVRMMNASLPTMLDESTRLESVAYDSNTIRYFHTIVDRSVDDLDVVDFHNTIKASVVNFVCDSSDMRAFLRNGIAYAYSYVDMAGEPVSDIIVVEDDCEQRGLDAN